MVSKKTTTIALILALLIVVVACGTKQIVQPQKQEEAPQVQEPTQEEIVEQEQKKEAKEEKNTITIDGLIAKPGILNIKVGDTVTWKNLDNYRHIIAWTKGPQYPIIQYETTTHTFEAPGEIVWFSTPYPAAQGKIIITE